MGKVDQGRTQKQQTEAAVFQHEPAQGHPGLLFSGRGEHLVSAGKVQRAQGCRLKQNDRQPHIGQNERAYTVGQKTQQQYAQRIKHGAKAPGRRVVYHRTGAVQFKAQLGQHGVAGDTGGDIQHVHQRDRRTLTGDQDQTEYRKGLYDQQKPADMKNGDAFGAVHQSRKTGGEQKTDDVAQGHHRAQLGIAVAPALKKDRAVAHRCAQTHPEKALKQRIDDAFTLFLFHRRSSQANMPADYSTGAKEKQAGIVQVRTPVRP